MNIKQAENTAIKAARAVGALMKRHQHGKKRAHSVSQHDIKLVLDVRSQKVIEKILRGAVREAGILGEEGIVGDPDARYRWVVDPIDGTVNFAYGIPHACVSIALQQLASSPGPTTYEDGYETVLGVVYDPFCDELWTALQGKPARLNGKPIHASSHSRLDESIVSIGFAKSAENLQATLPYFVDLVHKVRKIRMMGAAALALTYVASGRFDAYVERGIRLWDIAAGGFILERAGGDFCRQAIPGEYAYRMVASNGCLGNQLAHPW